MHIAFLQKQNIKFTNCWGKVIYNLIWTLNSFIYTLFKIINMSSLSTHVKDEFQSFLEILVPIVRVLKAKVEDQNSL
jgi:hypothetical protein